MKKADIMIAVLAVIIVIFGVITTHYNSENHNKNELTAIIKQDGKIINKIALRKAENKEIKISGKGNHYNLLSIKNGTVAVIEGDCPHNECIKMGSITKVGQVIACIPNKLIVYIEGEKKETEVDINSY